jgi:nucleotide-binding universal stress UspA family protein
MTAVEFKHILVATDFGEPAERAIDVALALAQKLGEPALTLVHVQYIPRPLYDVEVVWPTEALATSARKALDDALARAKKRYPKCEAVLLSGAPAEQIVHAAGRRGADLVVLGTHGREGLPRLLLGSVAERVTRTCPVPVLTVPAEESVAPEHKIDLARP